MHERSQALQVFLSGLRDAIETGRPPRSVSAMASRIFDTLESLGETNSAEVPIRLPVCRYVDQALAIARAAGGSIKNLAESLRGIEPFLTWSRRQGADEVLTDFAEGHANAMVVGPGGLETRTDISIGISLMAPNVQYPDHRHPPEEIYVALSAGAWRQADGPWVTPGIGGFVHNPPNIVHAMRSESTPLLAIWYLRHAE